MYDYLAMYIDIQGYIYVQQPPIKYIYIFQEQHFYPFLLVPGLLAILWNQTGSVDINEGSESIFTAPYTALLDFYVLR